MSAHQNSTSALDYAICVNVIGSFNCTCDEGYSIVDQQDGSYTCEQSNECEEGTHKCVAPAQCRDRSNGYACDCPAGYEKISATQCGGKRSKSCMYRKLNTVQKVSAVVFLRIAFCTCCHYRNISLE